MRIDNIINQLVLGVKKMIEQRKLYEATNDSVVTYPIQILITGRNSSIFFLRLGKLVSIKQQIQPDHPGPSWQQKRGLGS